GGCGRAEVREIAFQARFRVTRINNAVMIAWNTENRRRITPVWLQKLVVIILAFTKVIDNVAEMIEERGHICRIVFSKVRNHLVGYQRLRGGTNIAARI